MSEPIDSAPDGLRGVERTIALRRIDVFQAVPLEQLTYVAQVAHEEWFPADHVLFSEGDAPGPLYVILDGKVQLELGGSAFAEATSGEALGAWSLFDDQPRKATVRVLEDTRILVLDRDDFFEVLSEHMEVTRSMVQDLVRRLVSLAGLER